MVPVPFERTNLSKSWWKDAESREMVWNEYVKWFSIRSVMNYRQEN
jgi:hypothetical protein